MKVAIVGSRGLKVSNLEKYIPNNTTEIISGGAKGIDTCASVYAKCHDIKLTEFLPDYSRYGKTAPLKRNITIIENADLVLAFWDGSSRGTLYVINMCKKMRVPIKLYVLKQTTRNDEIVYI